MLSTANDVIAGNATWKLLSAAMRLSGCGRCRRDQFPMVLFSPPYEGQRTYGLNFKRKGQVWSWTGCSKSSLSRPACPQGSSFVKCCVPGAEVVL